MSSGSKENTPRAHDLVPCPVCTRLVEFRNLKRHIDTHGVSHSFKTPSSKVNDRSELGDDSTEAVDIDFGVDIDIEADVDDSTEEPARDHEFHELMIEFMRTAVEQNVTKTGLRKWARLLNRVRNPGKPSFPSTWDALFRYFGIDDPGLECWAFCRTSRCDGKMKWLEWEDSFESTEVAEAEGPVEEPPRCPSCDDRMYVSNIEWFFYHGVEASLRLVLQTTPIEEFLSWRNNFNDRNSRCNDVYDGTVWKAFVQQLNMMEDRVGGSLTILIGINMDWFSPFVRSSRKILGCYMYIYNLSREIRTLNDYVVPIFLRSVGSSEEKVDEESWRKTEMIVEELLRLGSEGFVFKNTVIYVRLLGTTNDIPANIKLFGVRSWKSRDGCRICTADWGKIPRNFNLEWEQCKYPTKRFIEMQSESDEEVILQRTRKRARSTASHSSSRKPRRKTNSRNATKPKRNYFEKGSIRDDVNVYRRLSGYRSASPDSRRRMFNQSGFRWTPWLKLDTFSPVYSIIPDAMHNLFLGVAKTILDRVSESDILSRLLNWEEIGEIVNSCLVPTGMDRPHRMLKDGLTKAKANEIQSFVSDFSSIVFPVIFPEEFGFLDMWERFRKLVYEATRFDSVSPGSIKEAGIEFQKHYINCFGPFVGTPKIHIAVNHLAMYAECFGPLSAHWTYAYERSNNRVGRVRTSGRSELTKEFLLHYSRVQQANRILNPKNPSEKRIVFSDHCKDVWRYGLSSEEYKALVDAYEHLDLGIKPGVDNIFHGILDRHNRMTAGGYRFASCESDRYDWDRTSNNLIWAEMYSGEMKIVRIKSFISHGREDNPNHFIMAEALPVYSCEVYLHTYYVDVGPQYNVICLPLSSISGQCVCSSHEIERQQSVNHDSDESVVDVWNDRVPPETASIRVITVVPIYVFNELERIQK